MRIGTSRLEREVPMAEVLVLRDVPERAWLDFQLRGERARAQEHPLTERWARARALGASHEGPPHEERLTRGADLRARIEKTDLTHALAPEVIDHATGVVARHDFLLVLSDAEGVVVRASGGGAFAEEARRVRLMEGADWKEASRGTNAIGTAIVEKRPVFVHGRAHFARRFHDLVCYAAPIFDIDGALLGVLDATSRAALADDAVGAAVVRAAHAIEVAIRARAYANAGASVSRTLGRALDRMSGGALLVEAPGRVVRMNAGARIVLREAAGTDVREVLGVSFTALVQEAREPRTEGLHCAAGRLRVEPIDASDGRALALLVLLEPALIARPSITLPKRPSLPPSSDAFAGVFCEDPAMRESLTWARRVAPSTIPVMLLAETGGGKEVVARAIHAASPRAKGPFRAINCGSLAPSLLESELFGYGPAAFTGAERRGRDGLMAVASGGTLFLDEVAEMPPPMQAALLRVLEDGTYQRVGETTQQRADVRVICATCRDLDALVQAGTFRKDLYFRLKGARVELPPLRARKDIVPLARHLLRTLAQKSPDERQAPSLSREVEALFARHMWPGNVRELRTVLEVALVLAAGGSEITEEHLPPDFAICESPTQPTELATAEGSAVKRVLSEVAGNVSLAAARLGVARSTLYRMMRRHGLK